MTFGAAGLVFALAAAFASWFVWPTPYRDFALRPGNFRVGYAAVLAARQHRVSGDVDVLTAQGWRPLTRSRGAALDSLRALAGETTPPP